MNNADMPAMPFTEIEQVKHGGMHRWGNHLGLKKSEQFCLKMGVPETGDPELDDIIRKGERKRIAAMAMQGALAAGDHFRASKSDIAATAIEYADALLKELEK